MSRLDQLQLQFRERLRLSHSALRDAGNTSVSNGLNQNDRSTSNVRPEAVKVQEIRRPRPVSKPQPLPTVPVSSSGYGYTSNRAIRPSGSIASHIVSNSLNQPSSNGRRGSVDLPQPLRAKPAPVPSAARPGQHARSSIQAGIRRASTSSVREAPKELSCAICSRKFALADRLAVHEAICSKSASKSRKLFDSTKQRFKNQPKEYLQAYQRALKEPSAAPTINGSNESNWREKHNRVIQAIRAAKYEACTSIELV